VVIFFAAFADGAGSSCGMGAGAASARAAGSMLGSLRISSSASRR
jgi:hypothetical protein